jgi:hypothetical protein
MMGDMISLGRFPLSYGWPSNTVQTSRLQDSGSQYLKAKATRIALRGFDQSVQCLCVGIGDSMIKVGEYGFVPVGNSREQGVKCLLQFGGNTQLPLLIAALGLCSRGCLPDVEKRLFEPIRTFQFREVLGPGFQDQVLRLVQITVAMQQDVAVMHQSASGGVGEFCSQGFAYCFKAFIRHFDHMKVINDHLRLWQHEANGIKIRTPHVHTDQGDFRLFRQAVQVVGDSNFVPVSKQIYDLPLGDVTDHTTGLVKQVNFIDPDTRAMSNGASFCMRIGFLEDTANSTLVYAGIIGNAGKGSPERLLCNIEHQALCHHVMLIHSFQWLIEGLVAGAATVALSDNQEGGSLASDGNIQKQLGLYLMPVQTGRAAMRATQRHRDLFGGDLIVVFVLIDRQNTIVRPTKYVQEMLSWLKILLDEFSEPLAFPVWKREVIPTNIRQNFSSTQFAGFWMWCTDVLFHVLCRIADYSLVKRCNLTV